MISQPFQPVPKQCPGRQLQLGWFLPMILFLVSGCQQPQVKLVINSISPSAKYLDVAIWRHDMNDAGIPSEPKYTAANKLSPITLSSTFNDYKISLKFNDSAKYSIYVASFSIAAETEKEKTVCLADVSDQVEVGPFTNEFYADTNISLHPAQDIDTMSGMMASLPASSCVTAAVDTLSNPLAPLVSRISVSSTSVLGTTGTQMAPPSVVTVEGWFFSPSPTVELYLIQMEMGMEKLSLVSLANSRISQRGANRFSFSLPSGMGANDLRGQDLELRVGSSPEKKTTVRTRL